MHSRHKKGHFDESTRPYLHIFQKLANLCRVVDPGLVHVQEHLLFLKISMSYLGWIKAIFLMKMNRVILFPVPYSVFSQKNVTLDIGTKDPLNNHDYHNLQLNFKWDKEHGFESTLKGLLAELFNEFPEGALLVNQIHHVKW